HMCMLRGNDHGALALPEQEGVGADHLARIDPYAERLFRAADATLRQRDRQATVGNVMGRTEQFLLYSIAATILHRLLHLEIDPRRRAARQPMNPFEILAAAQLFRSEEHTSELQ